MALPGKCREFRARPPRKRPALEFVVEDIEGPDGTRYRAMKGLPVYQYVWETGELGRDDQWCVVPEEFRAWMEYTWLHSGAYQGYQRENGLVVGSPPE